MKPKQWIENRLNKIKGELAALFDNLDKNKLLALSIYFIVLFSLLSFFIIAFISFPLIHNLSSSIAYILKINLGVLMSIQILDLVFSAFFLYLLLIFILFMIYPSQRRWFWTTIITLIFILIIGVFVIDLIINNPSIRLNILDEQNLDQGNVVCYGEGGPLKEGEKIICELDLPKNKFRYSLIEFVNLTFEDNSSELFYEVSLKGFYAPTTEKTKYIFFKILVMDWDGEYHNFSVGYPFKFVGEEEFKRNQEKFIALILGLIAVVFLSIPPLIKNIKDLWEDNTLPSAAAKKHRRTTILK